MCRVSADTIFIGEEKKGRKTGQPRNPLIAVRRNLIERIADTNFVLVTPQCNYSCPRVYIDGEYVKDA